MSYVVNAGVTLVHFAVGVYLIFVLLRFLLQTVRADFYNPIAQAIIKLTNPPLRFLRRLIPDFAGVDWPSIVLLLSVQMLEIVLLSLLIKGIWPGLLALLILSTAHILQMAAYVYIFLVFVMVIISWINPGAYNPVTALIHQLTEPLMRPIRRRIPATARLDFSPMLALLAPVSLSCPGSGAADGSRQQPALSAASGSLILDTPI